MDDLRKHQKEGKKRLTTEAYEQLKLDLQKTYDSLPEENTLKSKYKEVLDNWLDIVNISDKSLKVMGLTMGKKIADPNKVGSDPAIPDTELADIESIFERINYDDALTFMIDPKKNMSSKLKTLLSFIPAMNDDGKTQKRNYLGWDVYIPYNQVSHYLNAILAGADATDEGMLAALKEDLPRNPWVQNLIDHIEMSERDVKNQLLMTYSSHQAKFKTHLWEMVPVKEEGPNGTVIKRVDGKIVYKYKSRIIDTNQNSIAKVIQKQWYENIKNVSLDLVKVNPKDPSQLIINPETAKSLLKEFEEIN